jgi:hypothetical protein
MVEVGHCRNQRQFLLQEDPCPRWVLGQLLETGQIPKILQEVQFLPDVLIEFLLGLSAAVDEEIGAAEQANCDPILELIEYLLGVLDVVALQLEEFPRHHDALIVYFVVEVLKIPFPDLHPAAVHSFLCRARSLLFDHLALLFVDSPVLGTVFGCAVLGYFAVSAHENRLPLADLTALHQL